MYEKKNTSQEEMKNQKTMSYFILSHTNVGK